MLRATPETIWLPRWLMQAKPCRSAKASEAMMAAASPTRRATEGARRRRRREGRGQHLALEPDVDDA